MFLVFWNCAYNLDKRLPVQWLSEPLSDAQSGGWEDKGHMNNLDSSQKCLFGKQENLLALFHLEKLISLERSGHITCIKSVIRRLNLK